MARRQTPAYRDLVIDHGAVVQNGWLVLSDELEVLFAFGKPVRVAADPELHDCQVLEALRLDGILARAIRWDAAGQLRAGDLEMVEH